MSGHKITQSPNPARRRSVRQWLRRNSGAPSASPATVRRTEQGDVIGFVADNGSHAWRGIPFAASTAGPNRWRAPQPPPDWSHVREALEFAPRCAQLTNELDKQEGLAPGLVVGSEDCLALDIYAPPQAQGQALPVMVWIHGGGNVWGSSSKYDGSHLARDQNLILVAVQYRVGPLGWFAHPALRDSAEVPEDRTACFATLDLIASLRWVRDNIAAFGGDPGRVTIFGESAGGHNVVTLLASKLAAGLFHRAIVQSGAFESTPLSEAVGDDGDLLNPAKRIAEKLQARTADQLRAIPVDQLLGAYTRGRGFVDVPRVIQDGVVLPSGPLLDAFASKNTFNAVPIILGTNRDEMKLFYLGDDRLVKKRLGVFPVARTLIGTTVDGCCSWISTRFWAPLTGSRSRSSSTAFTTWVTQIACCSRRKRRTTANGSVAPWAPTGARLHVQVFHHATPRPPGRQLLSRCRNRRWVTPIGRS